MLGLAAVTLDYAVLYTVVKMGDYVNGLSAVGVVWRIFRDIGNIALIFGFLAIGISVIIDNVKFGYNKNMLPTLLIVAVTLNFSLFAAEAVVDVGNLFATQIYQQIRGGQPAGAAAGADITNEGISNRIMAQLGLQSIYGAALQNRELYANNNSLIVGLLSIILFLVAAFIFFSLALILVFRFMALILVIMTAPVGFAGLVVPKLGPTASRWWGELVNQTLTAPVLLLLLYVSLAVITDAKFLTGFGVQDPNSWTATLGVSGGAMAGMLLSFIVAMGLLGRVAAAAKGLGAVGADVAMNAARKASFGAAAGFASGAVNIGGYAARKGIQKLGLTGAGAQLAMRGALAAQGARVDVRRLPGVGAGLSMAGVAAGAPSATSPYAQGTAARKSFQERQKAAGKAVEAEMRIPLLLKAGNDKDRAKLLNNMTDDELKSGEITQYFKDNPGAISLLTPKKIMSVDRSLLTGSDENGNNEVTKNLSGAQIDEIKASAREFTSEEGRSIGKNLWQNDKFIGKYASSKEDRQEEYIELFGDGSMEWPPRLP
jgi:hypothetical protein